MHSFSQFYYIFNYLLQLVVEWFYDLKNSFLTSVREKKPIPQNIQTNFSSEKSEVWNWDEIAVSRDRVHG